MIKVDPKPGLIISMTFYCKRKQKDSNIQNKIKDLNNTTQKRSLSL